MARPQKYNADYFPHSNDLRNDRRVKALRGKFGSVGYTAYVMLLEILTKSDHFQIAYSELEMELLAGDFGIESALFSDIIQYLLSLNLLEEKDNIIYSPDLNESLQGLVEYRQKERSRKSNRKQQQIEVSPVENTVLHTENPETESFSVRKNPHSKVKYSIVGLSCQFMSYRQFANDSLSY